MANFIRTALVAALCLISTAIAGRISPDTHAVCAALYAQYPDLVVYDPLGPDSLETLENASLYREANFKYWNAANSLNRAACGFFPANAQQVSFAVKALNRYPDVKFAMKCAGHNPNKGFSSVDRGVLISFRANSAQIVPSKDGKVVEVGSGAAWEDVYGALEPLGKAVVGGRLGGIGVTGLTTGGGLSYLSAQHGLACDNVVNFQVVLADGTIDNANATHNDDLFFALRGGGTQYAVVTKMTLKMYDIGTNGKVWGGARTFGAAQHSAILSAVADFTANNDDPKAAIIPTFDFIGVGINVPVALLFFFYDGESAPPDVFRGLLDLPHLSSDTKARSYLDLTTTTVAGNGDIFGLRFQIRTETIPNMPLGNMTDYLNDLWETVARESAINAIVDLVDVKLVTTALQPVPHGIHAKSLAAGGNALGMHPSDGDRIWIELDVAWASPLCDKHCPEWLEKLGNKLHQLHVDEYSGIPPTNYKSGDLEAVSYQPLFMNDAMYNQEVIESYGDGNYAKLKKTQAKYDPEGFFKKRTQGFGFAT